jgi:sulfur-carrier protein
LPYKPITLEDPGLTEQEMELFAKGARHLFGSPETDDEDTAEEDTPLVTVRIPANLRRLTGQRDEVQINAGTVGAALSTLNGLYPGFIERIFDERGSLRRFVLVVLNDETIANDEVLSTPTKTGDEISIIPALAGG